MLFVTYARTQKGSDDELAGQGRGIVDAYATDGTFLGRVATRGQLNAPWGLAWAPADFGRFSNDLIVGNFGDGQAACLPLERQALASGRCSCARTTSRSSSTACGRSQFGGGTNVVNDGPANTLFYTAGPNDEAGGAFGTITAAMP